MLFAFDPSSAENNPPSADASKRACVYSRERGSRARERPGVPPGVAPDSERPAHLTRAASALSLPDDPGGASGVEYQPSSTRTRRPLPAGQ